MGVVVRVVEAEGSKVCTLISNKRVGWNKRGGGAKNAKSLNVEGAINVNF